MEATARMKITFLLTKKSCFPLFLFRSFPRRSIFRSLEEDPAQKQSCKQTHPAAMLTPIQEASPASLHGSNSKEENNLSSNKEKLFSSFLVSRVSS